MTSVESASVMDRVANLMDRVKSESPVYDHASYPQVQKIRFEELKNAFVQFDPERKGTIKTKGIGMEVTIGYNAVNEMVYSGQARSYLTLSLP